MTVKRTPTYPDEAPEISIRPNAVPETAEEGDQESITLSEQDLSELQVKVEEEVCHLLFLSFASKHQELTSSTQAQANLGMAMCFQLQSVLSEQISVLLVQKEMQAENERAQRQADEEEVRLWHSICIRMFLLERCGLTLSLKPQAEAARTRGTPVTPESFAGTVSPSLFMIVASVVAS